MALTWPEIRENMRQYLVRLIRKTTLAGSSADGKSEQADGYERGPGDPSYGFGLRRMQSYGFASWVPRAAEIVALAINGGKNNRVYVASDLPGAAPTLANEGDTVIFNSKATGGTTTIYMDHSGNITIIKGSTTSGSTPTAISPGSTRLRVASVPLSSERGSAEKVSSSAMRKTVRASSSLVLNGRVRSATTPGPRCSAVASLISAMNARHASPRGTASTSVASCGATRSGNTSSPSRAGAGSSAEPTRAFASLPVRFARAFCRSLRGERPGRGVGTRR